MNRNELVSIILLSCNKAHLLDSTIKSILVQTYLYWELIIVDDASSDGSIQRIMDLRDGKHCFKISQCVFTRGQTANRNSALRDAKGKWIAFIDNGDIWEPTKLEKQVGFMEDYGFAFTYSLYKLIDKKKGRNLQISGPETISEKDMMKCCWMGYLTVMYDRERIGFLQIEGLRDSNDYALWLLAVQKADCQLYPECLASQLSENSIAYRLLTSEKFLCRYESYRKIYKKNPLSSLYLTFRNLAYTMWKWWKYAKCVE